jgi:hypothetical protein
MKKSSLQIAVAQIPIEQDDDVLMEGRKEVWSSSPEIKTGGTRRGLHVLVVGTLSFQSKGAPDPKIMPIVHT